MPLSPKFAKKIPQGRDHRIGVNDIPDASINPVVLERKVAQPVQAREHLAHVGFFAEFNTCLPGLIGSLAKVAKIQKSKAGTVIFRQDDEAEDCYVIMNGDVGVFVRDKDDGPQTSPRNLRQIAKAEKQQAAEARNCWDKLVERCLKLADENQDDQVTPVEDAQVFVKTKARVVTAEGHNTYNVCTCASFLVCSCTPSNFGSQVTTLKNGDVFGELGLLEEKPRAATVKCLSKCTFLVIPKESFKTMFGGHISKGKISLFVARVPGFQEWAGKNMLKTELNKHGRIVVSMQSHPCDCFQKQFCAKGVKLLTEGEHAEPQIIVIGDGAVDFHRMKFSFPRFVAQRGSNCWENPARPTTPTSPGFLKPVKIQKAMTKTTEISDETLRHRIGNRPGTPLCSMGFFELPGAEPFTVVTKCQMDVYICKGEDLKRLPQSIHMAIREDIVVNLGKLLCESPGFNSFDTLNARWREQPISPVEAEMAMLQEIDDAAQLLR